MRAVQLTSFDGPAGLTLAEIDPAPLGRRQVRIKVEAAALNFADILMMTGTYQATPEPPFTLGLEAAGVVTEADRDADGVFVGDRVMVHIGSGAFAEEIVVDDLDCFVIPPEMPFDEAAAFPVAYGTAHLGLTRRGRLAEGEVLLVHGAAGGVGLTAVQVGKALGATVVATAGSAEKLAIAETAGADHLIDYSSESIRDRVKETVGGVDVVFDPVGGDAFSQSLRCIRPEGRILVIGFAGGEVPQIPANILLVKNADVIGFYWGSYVDLNRDAFRQSMEDLLLLYRDGRLRPHVGARFPFAEAETAYDLLRSRMAAGKIILTPA